MRAARSRPTLIGAAATALGATALFPLFSDAAFVGYCLGAVLAVLVGHLAARRLGVPTPLVPYAGLGVLAVYLTVVFVPGSALGGVLPWTATPEAVRELVRQASGDIRDLTTPVPGNTGLLLLATGGVGLVALLVNLLAVTLRRPALAGLPLLALFAVPAAVVPGGVGVGPFVAGAVGYLALLLSDGRDRVNRWGHPVRKGRDLRTASSAADRAGAAPLAALGRRIGVTALGVSLLVPAFVPGLQTGLLSGGNGFGSGSGSTRVQTYNPIVSLRGQLREPTEQEILRIRSDDPTPSYLRLTTLDTFDGSTWSSSDLSGTAQDRVDQGIPPPAGLSSETPARTVHSQISITSLATRWLPVPYPARRVDVDGDWRYDPDAQVVWSPKTTTRDQDYSVVSTVPEPSSAYLQQLPPANSDLDAFRQVPTDVAPSVRELVAQITAGASTPYDRAAALQAFFHDDSFTYSLTVPQGNSEDDLVNFLDQRVGYCEQFAAAMALMARLAGIPSRVAIGFTAGDEGADGTRSVTNKDAHSWPELFFPRVGWLPFEPTPTGDGRAIPPAYTVPPAAPVDTPAGGGDVANAPPPHGSAGAAAGQAGTQPKLREPSAVDSALDAGSTGSGQSALRLLLTIGLVALLLVLAATPLLLRLATRRRRWAGSGAGRAAETAWAELGDDAADVGLAVPDSASPRQIGELLRHAVSLDASADAALTLIVQAEERSRYAPGLDRSGGGVTPADVRGVRVGLQAGVGPVWRWRARCVPASSLRRCGSWVAGRCADGLDGLDAVVASVRAVAARRLRAVRRAH